MLPKLGATSLLDRQSDKRPNREYVTQLLDEEKTQFLVLAGGKPVINSDEKRTQASIRWFEKDQLQKLKLPIAEAIFLGTDKDSTGRFALPITEHLARHAPGARGVLDPFVDIRSLANQGVMAPEELSLVGQASALANWHHNTRCCGRCGGSMQNREGGWKRECWSCKHEEYPRMDPVVLIAITDGERLILAREDRFSPEMYSTLAGYVEPGDTIIHAVHRETKEEIGLDVDEVTFVGSQPWPYEHSLMLGCFARTAAKEIAVNKNELADARWFDRDEITAMMEGKHKDGLWVPGKFSLAHKLISDFLKNRI